jgi:hypothetical protein
VTSGINGRRAILATTLAFVVLAAGCSRDAAITAPTIALAAPAVISLEGELGSGQGDIRERSRASGGRTVHLAPGEERIWAIPVSAAAASYSISVIYSNGQEGPNETLTVGADGVVSASKVNRDSGDAIEGWNTFIADPFGVAVLGGGIHTVFIQSRGGDGCVEIDRIVLTPM